MQELEQVPGTGKKGRLTKKDLLNYLKPPQDSPLTDRRSDLADKHSSGRTNPVIDQGQQEVIEMDRMRKMIASRMLESQKISAHVTFLCRGRRYGHGPMAPSSERCVFDLVRVKKLPLCPCLLRQWRRPLKTIR